MGRLKWYPDAKQERALAIVYCRKYFGKQASIRLEETLHKNNILLLQNPHMGTIEPRLDYLPVMIRYLVVGHYKEYYYVKDEEIRILRLWHCVQDPEKVYTYFTNNPQILCEERIPYQTRHDELTPQSPKPDNSFEE